MVFYAILAHHIYFYWAANCPHQFVLIQLPNGKKKRKVSIGKRYEEAGPHIEMYMSIEYAYMLKRLADLLISSKDFTFWNYKKKSFRGLHSFNN